MYIFYIVVILLLNVGGAMPSTSDIDLQRQEAEFYAQRKRGIEEIAKEKNISISEATQEWDDDYNDALENDYE